jgi:Uma2 family endonuclease
LELENGAHLTRAEFHRLYERMPPSFKAELIEGIVHVPSPLRIAHSDCHLTLGAILAAYRINTPGVGAGDNATILLGKAGEPQPDLYMRILPEYGGQSKTTPDNYVEGAPELVAEFAGSSQSIDFHAKLRDYKRYGVLEYLVLSLREQQLHWFDLQADQELSPDSDGIIRVRCFPGLWIDVEALIQMHPQILSVLAKGLATSEHAAFASMLATAHASYGHSGTSSGRRRRSRRKSNGNSV